MAEQVAGKLFARYGNKLDSFVQKHANDDTRYGFIALPGGISNGVAQLSICGFKQYEKGTNMKTATGSSAEGEVYWYARGIVQEPESVMTPDGRVSVFGLQTSIQVPLCATKDSNQKVTSHEDQVERILNHLRMLGGEEFTAEVKTLSDLQLLCDMLNETKPYFRFSTTLSKPKKEGQTPRVFENWHGTKGLDDYVPPVMNATEDNLEEEVVEAPKVAPKAPTKVQSNGASNGTPAATTAPAKRGPGRPPKAKTPEVTKEIPKEEFNEFEDLDSLIQQATNEDEDVAKDAQYKLWEIAEKLGITEDQFTNANGFEEIKKLIESASSGESAEETEEESEIPEVGWMVKYAPKGLGGKRLTPVTCEITTVDPDSETVTLKNMKTKKEYTEVPFSELEPNE